MWAFDNFTVPHRGFIAGLLYFKLVMALKVLGVPILCKQEFVRRENDRKYNVSVLYQQSQGLLHIWNNKAIILKYTMWFRLILLYLIYTPQTKYLSYNSCHHFNNYKCNSYFFFIINVKKRMQNMKNKTLHGI